MKDHAAGVSTADDPRGMVGAVAVHHPLGMSQVTSLRRGRVKSRGKSRVMERREGDLAAGAVQDAGLMRNILKARKEKNEVKMTKKGRVEKGEKSARLVAVVVRTTAGILDALAERTGKEGKKTMNPSPKMKRLLKLTAPRINS